MACGVVSFPILLLAVLASQVNAHRILMLPITGHFTSHLLQVRTIVDILFEAGHDVTLLINTKAVEYRINEHASLATYHVPEEWSRQIEEIFMVHKAEQMTGKMKLKMLEIISHYCDALLSDKKLLYELKAANFDLVFVDIWNNCGRIMLEFLGVPSIVYQPSGFTSEIAVVYPQISSFVCHTESPVCNNNHMNFMDRTINLVSLAFRNYVAYPITYHVFNRLSEKHKMNISDVSTTFSRSVVLVHTDFVLEYPRPLMPNVFLISGLFRRESRPLGLELMQFVEDSAPHGVVVLSFGTAVTKFETQQAEIIASVFGRLKQKVIWRNTGPRPRALANNTMLTGWFPQNDVLAHPLTKVFITHCGISSIYETIHNKVPVVAVPLDWDQHYQAGILVNRVKIGVMLDFNTFQEHDLESALHEVLDNPSYLENTKAAAAVLSDQPIPPKQQLLNLFDYVIRHKGAKHLVSDAALRLNIFQFYSLDVVCALICAMCVTIITSVLTTRILWRHCWGGATPRQKLD